VFKISVPFVTNWSGRSDGQLCVSGQQLPNKITFDIF